MEAGQTLNVHLPHAILEPLWNLVVAVGSTEPPEGDCLHFEYPTPAGPKECWVQVDDPEVFFTESNPLYALIKLGVPNLQSAGILITYAEGEDEDEEIEVEVEVSARGILITTEMQILRSVLDKGGYDVRDYLRDHFDPGSLEVWIDWYTVEVSVDGSAI